MQCFFLEVNEDQGSTFSPVQININIYIIHFTHFVRFCILHSWSLFLRGIGAAITDNMSDNVHLGDFCMSYFLLSDSLFRCVTWNESTFSLECCRQSVSGWVLPAGSPSTNFCLTVQMFICIYWKSKFCSFMFRGCSSLHTHFSTTLNTNTSCIWSLCFLFPRWGCQRWGNDALTNKSITSMNVGMQHIAIKAPFEMQLVSCTLYIAISACSCWCWCFVVVKNF